MNIQTKTNKSVALFAVAALLVGVAGVGPLVSEAANASEKIDVFIGFNQTPGASEQALVRAFGGEISHSYHLVPAIAASIPESAIAGLSRNPNVTDVEPDGTVYAVDAELERTWGVERIGSGDVHDGGNKGTGVKIGIIDSDFYASAFIAAVVNISGADSLNTPRSLKLGINRVYSTVGFNVCDIGIPRKSRDC